MSAQNKILHGLALSHAALILVIFCLMVLSFPIGAYLVFNSEIGDNLTYEYPMDGFSLFLAGIGFDVPITFELGDGFIVIWCIFLILFATAILGPKKKIVTILQSMISGDKYKIQDNYIVATIKWFSILVIVSGTIIAIQEFIGISVEQPEASNQLIQFFDISLAFLIKSLWMPLQNLHSVNMKKVLILIVVVGIFFGAAHIFSDEAWSSGKLVQAVTSGIIIGWVYVRYGLVPAILIHWATNYFIFSYGYIIADINQISIIDSFSHSLLNTLELILIITGIISVAVLVMNYVYSKKYTLKT